MDNPRTRGAQAPPLARVLLIDSATLTRECVADMLRRETTGFAIAGVEHVAACADMPDAVLLNIHAARVDDTAVLDRIAEIRRQLAETPLAVIAEREDAMLVTAALRVRLRGYLPTSLGPRTLAAAIALILAGGTYIPPPHVPDLQTASPDAFGLTRREHDVLALLRAGMPNKLIAHELAITEATVKVHVRSIMTKLRAANRTQLAVLGSAAAPRRDRSAA